MTRQKTASLYIRSSAGELEWILPVLYKLANLGFKVEIFSLFQRGQKSCQANSTCRMGLDRFATKASPIFDSKRAYVYELLNRIFAFLYKKGETSGCLWLTKLCDFIASLIVRILGWNHVSDLAFIEFPADKSIFAAALRYRGAKNYVFYFPHSPHVYGSSIVESVDTDGNTRDSKSIYLFGTYSDYSTLEEGGWKPLRQSRRLYIGHPKLSSEWISVLESWFSVGAPQRSSVAILSRGVGNFLSIAEQRYLCETTLRVLSNYECIERVYVKLHPREIAESLWLESQDPRIEITAKSIAELFVEVDFVIGFWTSAALDALAFDKVFLEFYRPAISTAEQLLVNGKYQTVYESMGMVHAARSERDLNGLVDSAVNLGLAPAVPEDQIKMLMTRSNDWWKLMLQGLRYDPLFQGF